jgi:hypothetical protein
VSVSDAFGLAALRTVMASAGLVRLGGGDMGSGCLSPLRLMELQPHYSLAGSRNWISGDEVSPNISSPEQLDVSTPASVVHFPQLGGVSSAQWVFFTL